MTEPTPPAPAPGYQQPQPYVNAPYGTTAYGTPLAPRTNTLAIVALILAFFVPIGAIICGHIALGQIKTSGEGGHGLAFAGTVLGYVFTGLGILLAIGYIAVIIAAVGTAGLSGTLN